MSQPPSEPHPGERHPEPPTSGLPTSGLPTSGLPTSGLPQPGWPRSDDTAVFPAQATSDGFTQPGHPQPGYPQPGYPQPGYPQPGYPQQGYPQPGNPQVGYPQAGFTPAGYPQDGYAVPGYPAGAAGAFPPPRRRSKALPIVLGAVAVLLVLCVGGITAVFVMLRKDVGNEPVAAPLGTRATDRPAPGVSAAPRRTLAPPPAEAEVKLVAPVRLGGRPKLTDPQFAGAARTLQDSLRRAPGATSSIGALYGDPEKRNIVVIAAVAAPVLSPDRELSATMLGVGATGTKLTGIVTVDPGPLGGTAQCGNSATSGVRMAMCVWADNGSVGWFVWYFKSVKQVIKEFPKLRAQVEKTG